MYTLQNIKDEYYCVLMESESGETFEQYLRNNYIPIYDGELNFKGYIRDVWRTI
jgi:hypothetical protein